MQKQVPLFGMYIKDELYDLVKKSALTKGKLNTKMCLCTRWRILLDGRVKMVTTEGWSPLGEKMVGLLSAQNQQ